MTHRKLYWILTLLIVIAMIALIVAIAKVNFSLITGCVVAIIILSIVRKIVKVDNNLKNRRDE